MNCSKMRKGIVRDSTEETYRVPAGKGDRSIVRHIGSAETGLLNNCLLILGIEVQQVRWLSFWNESKCFRRLV